MKIQGVIAPLTTPFTHEGEIYPAKIAANVQRLNQLALTGYAVGGSTGESKLLSHDEKERVFALVAESAASEKLLIAGTAMESVKETVELTNHAAGLGYKAALILTPHYYKNLITKPEAQLLYFRTVADQAKIPLIIYNFPQNSGYDMPADVVVQLSQHPNIAGIKESSGNLGKVIEMIRDVKPGFQVMVGHAQTFYPALLMGATAGILAFANCAPYSLITIWEAFRQREHEAALEWQKRISGPVTSVVAKHGIPGIKYAMELKGYYGGPARLPLAPLNDAAKKEIDALMADISS